MFCSHRAKSLVGLSLFVSATALLSACGPRGPLQVDLEYAPTSQLELKGISGEIVSTPIKISQVSDGREGDRTEIGVNSEGSKDIPALSSSEQVVQTVHVGLVESFKEAGLQVNDNADVDVQVEVKRIWVEEGGTYKGEVRLAVKVYRSGALSGEMLVGGTASRWGSSAKPENYREVLSDSLIEASVNLLNMPEFAEAIAGKGTAQPAAQNPEENASPEDKD